MGKRKKNAVALESDDVCAKDNNDDNEPNSIRRRRRKKKKKKHGRRRTHHRRLCLALKGHLRSSDKNTKRIGRAATTFDDESAEPKEHGKQRRERVLPCTCDRRTSRRRDQS